MSYSEGLDFGTPSHMLYRTTDPYTSKESAELVESAKQQMKIFEAIKSFGEDGCISDDLMDFFGFEDQREDSIAYSGITGCYAPLERKFYIERRGDQRNGHRFNRSQLVMRALSDEERERRQRLRDASLSQGMLWEDVDLLFKWWKANESLAKAKEIEYELRSTVIGKLFSNVGYGKFSMSIPSPNLPNQKKFEVLANISPRTFEIRIEEITERKLRKMQEEQIASELSQPAFDNGR